MITDGYSENKVLANFTCVRHGACWSNVRRYLYKVYKASNDAEGIAREALGYIARLFKIKSRHKEYNPDRRCVTQNLYMRAIVEKIRP